MAITRVKSWTAGEVLTANDLNNEFNNVTNNALIEPVVLTQQFDVNGQLLLLDADGDTLLDASTNNVVDVTIGGADDFRFAANSFTALSGSSITLDSGNLTLTSGALTVTDGATSLADADSRTNTVATPLTITATTSGTPAAGIGTGILYRAESQDESPSDFGQTEFAASDVNSGTEDTYFQVLLRVAGAALTACYRFAATGAFKAIFTHANTADRSYAFPDVTDNVVLRSSTDVLTNKTFNAQGTGNSLTNVSTSALKTATGSASGTLNSSSADVTMNDYSFFPSVTNAAGGGEIDVRAIITADPSNTTGRLRVLELTGTSTTYTVRWRYVTASDDPTMWALVDPVTGDITGSWVSDDPPTITEDLFVDDPIEGFVMRRITRRNPDPPIASPGYLAKPIPLDMLSQFGLSQAALDAADRHIEKYNLKPERRLYRALQFQTRDVAPSGWLLENGIYKGNEFRLATAQEKQAKKAK